MNIAFLISFLDAVIHDDQEFFNNPDNIHMGQELTSKPFDEWSVIDQDPLLLVELVTLSQIINSMLANRNDEDDYKLISDQYLSIFGTAFTDVDPTTPLSVSGWINLNYSREHEERYGTIPSCSIVYIVEFIDKLIEASPTCDETLPENILSVILEHKQSGDDEALNFFVYNEMNDACFELSKIINKYGASLFNSMDKSNPDDLSLSMAEEIVSIIQDTVSAIVDNVDPNELEVHGASILNHATIRLVNTTAVIVESLT